MIYFASITRRVSGSVTRKVLQHCDALPFEYVQRHPASPLKMVLVRGEKFTVLGQVSSVLDPAELLQREPLPGVAPGLC